MCSLVCYIWTLLDKHAATVDYQISVLFSMQLMVIDKARDFDREYKDTLV